MYQLYIANKNYSSWSLRPWSLLRELSIPFTELLPYPFGVDLGGKSIRDVSPSGKVPCLVDGEQVVWDSLAIAEYLAEKHPGVWPEDRAARAFARCAAAEMHSGFSELRERCTMNCGIRVRIDSFSPALSRDIARLSELWNQGLSRFGGPFLAGPHFTAADAFYTPVAFRAQSYNLEMDPASMQYVARLRNLPSMKEWYAAALQEPWRDEPHEAEARRTGTLLADHRAPLPAPHATP